ncbi:metallophosphoesterase [Mumia sp. zg.B53]|uniref:metallophosphoesterase n=1 Tax=Mumia sp. zg.B53 TaxID=2855449 RepID=UPI001C6E6BC4|nr:metallophosphoesterase [Mumia sp. zg.B53]MBW9214826.1 metallophosphoesterase [Mumia sp. zg.B53]
MHPLTKTLLATTAAGTGALAYASLYERNAFVVREIYLPVLPAEARPLTVLQISDVHMTPGQSRKQRWLRSLVEYEPDLVVNTGDNLAHLEALPAVLQAYNDLLGVPGVFVFGSNDYYSPTLKNPAGYLMGPSGVRRRTADLPYEEMRTAFSEAGWIDLNNATGKLDVRGLSLSFAGLDDPHVDRDDLEAIPTTADPSADLAIAVVHAPYLRAIDAFNVQGYPLILAGHTHGGQLRVPGFGALVTNCDIDRRRARGLHQHRTAGHDASWLHVSAGCGTSPYAPVRFACRPEATVLRMRPVDSPRN